MITALAHNHSMQKKKLPTSRPENADSNSDSASSPAWQKAFHLKTAIAGHWFSHFSSPLYPNGCISHTASVQKRVNSVPSWLGLSDDSLAYSRHDTLSFIDNTMTIIANALSCCNPNALKLWTLHTSFCYHFFHSLLSFFFWRMYLGHSLQLSSIISYRSAPPDRSRSGHNFADASSCSDSGQNGRLHQTPTPASTPTLQPCLR